MSYYSMYNYHHMPTMYGGYNGYHPYMYRGHYPSYYYGTPGYYPYNSNYYSYRSPSLFRNMYNRLRYGSSYYYPDMGYWPYERDFSSTKNVWKRNGIY